MATIEIEIAGRRYMVGCADGEEDHLRSVALLVDARARDAAQALGSLTETRQLLFAALLLADDLKDARGGAAGTDGDSGSQVTAMLEDLADRVEQIASNLESAR
jgi:cell division protein ZapA